MAGLVRRAAPPALLLGALMVLWELWAGRSTARNPVLPPPSRVWRAFLDTAPLLPDHLRTTLTETAVGVAAGTFAGVVIAVAVAASPVVRSATQPLLVASQTVPVQVLAPLLVLWFGFGLMPKIVVVALVVFFPVAVATTAGLQHVDPELIELVRSYGAGRRRILTMVAVPSALPGLFAGLRISLTYAVAGAVIAESVGATSGLGLFIARSQRAFRYDQVFVGVAVVAVLSMSLFALVTLLQAVACPWLRSHE